jgi:hypothetical protein
LLLRRFSLRFQVSVVTMVAIARGIREPVRRTAMVAAEASPAVAGEERFLGSGEWWTSEVGPRLLPPTG